jgi:hypothetical protein
LLDRLDALFNIYSSITKQPIRFLVSFLNSASCFGGKFLSASDAEAYTEKLFFDFNGTKTDIKFDSPMVNINLNFISGTLYHDELGLCTVVQSLSKVIEFQSASASSSSSPSSDMLCSVCDCADPYWMLIVHEMEHMEHFFVQEIVKFCSSQFFEGKAPDVLEEKFVTDNKQFVLNSLRKLFSEVFSDKRCLMIEPIRAMRACLDGYNLQSLKEMCHELYKVRRYSDNKAITPQDVFQLLSAKIQLPDPLPSLPEVVGRASSHSHLWDNLEERETVVGSKNSELILRLAAMLPIRYIYQPKGKRFYEDFSTVFQIVKEVSSDITPDFLVIFINDDVHTRHFDTRKFRHIVDEELLPDRLFVKFGFTHDVMVADLPYLEAPLKPMPPGLVKRTLIPKIIKSFAEDNMKEVVSNLCSIDFSTIKPEIKTVLSKKGANEVITEVETHIRNTGASGTYRKDIIQKIVDLLSSAR